MKFFSTKTGIPCGNVRIGRRFTDHEVARILAGEDPEAIVAAAGPVRSRPCLKSSS